MPFELCGQVAFGISVIQISVFVVIYVLAGLNLSYAATQNPTPDPNEILISRQFPPTDPAPPLVVALIEGNSSDKDCPFHNIDSTTFNKILKIIKNQSVQNKNLSDNQMKKSLQYSKVFLDWLISREDFYSGGTIIIKPKDAHSSELPIFDPDYRADVYREGTSPQYVHLPESVAIYIAKTAKTSLLICPDHF